MDDNFDGIKQIINEIIKLNEIEIKEISQLVFDVINLHVTDENYISHLFDRMLSLSFVKYETIYNLYYPLINYTKTFNLELADDYEKIFIDQFYDEEIPKKLELM